jgi:amino acid adenylation domain-containing protein
MNQGPSFAHVLWERAQEAPDRVAIDFSGEEAALTYGALHRRAAALAARLRQVAAPGDRAVLILPPGLDYVTAFFGCLYAGVIAVPTYPPMDERQVPRLVSVLADCRPQVVLTLAGLVDLTRKSLAAHGVTGPMRWLPVDSGGEEHGDDGPPRTGADDVAFLQYTSGSTSAPKGTIVTHANLLDNSAAIKAMFGHSEESVGVIWLPPYHDMGLIGGILQPVYAGFPVVLMSPLSFLADPRTWLAAVSEHRATTSGGPNFAFDLCVRKITPERREGLDLSSWSVAFCGAEPVRRETMDRFVNAFGPYGFAEEALYPCYGLAESTLIVSGVTRGTGLRELPAERHTDAHRTVVSCGRAIPGHVIETLRPGGTTPVPEGEIGEICVRGPSVALGYWNAPEGTEATFTAGQDGVRLLRTGDLGFLSDGELYVTGRMKDLVIVRGRNLAAEDVEDALNGCHRAVRPGGVTAFEIDVRDEAALAVLVELAGTGSLVRAEAAAGPRPESAAEARRDASAEADLATAAGIRREIAAEVQRALAAAFGVRAERILFARRGVIPKTSSGKIRRSECRRRYLAGELDLLADELTGAHGGTARDDETPRLAARIAGLAAAVLEAPASEVGTDAALTSAGLDSLRAVELCHVVRRELAMELPLRELLSGASALELARIATPGSVPPPDAAARRNSAPWEVHGPAGDEDHGGAAEDGVAADGGAADGGAADGLSDGETGLWLASRLSGDPRHYVLAVALDLAAPVDPAVLALTVRMLAARHPALRTYFPEIDGRPRRRPCPEPLTLRVTDLGDVDDTEFERAVREHANAGIDPAAGPLWRVSLVRRSRGLAAGGGVLVLGVHHMACDVWSLDLLASELGEGYVLLARGRRPDWKPAGDPAVLAARRTRLLAGGRGRELAAFWRDELDQTPPAAALPQARPHHQVAAPAGEYGLRAPEAVVDRLLALVRETGATPYTVLLTGFAWSLYRYTGERRFVLGMPASGRLDPESASAVGYFVNPLPLVCEIDPDEDFLGHLRRFAGRVAAAQAHQDHPYQRILADHVPPGRGDELIRVLIAQQQAPSGHAPSLLAEPASGLRLGDLEVRTRFVTQHTVPFELSIEMVATGDGLGWSLAYDTGALTGADVEAFARHSMRLLDEVTSAPWLRPGEVEILSDGERHLLLEEWNPDAPQGDEPGTADVAGPSRSAHQIGGIHEAVLAMCAAMPDAVAVQDDGGGLTFGELDRRSAGLASALTARGAAGERPVALLMPRSADLVVAMVAAMRAGSPYLPLDVDHPDARLAAILEDARPAVVVTTAGLAATRPVLHGHPVLVEDGQGDPGVPAEAVRVPPAHPDGLAYVIYTSGSTGTPKGVACGHRGVLNLAADLRSRVPIGPGDRCGWWTSPGFDVSVHEVFTALTAGAAVEVCPPHARDDAGALMEWIAGRGITGAYLPPHLLPDIAGWLARDTGRVRLRWVLVGVEPIPEPLLRRIAHLVPGIAIVNGYGPTESAVCATFHEVDPAGAEEGVTPLGRPLRNCSVYLLDGRMNPVPIGAVGEIYIGGHGLARGYHGRPGLTAERFVPSPFAPGRRLYRTGDLARHRRDGQLLFVGRADHQVKVRGMRVEPREIETVMVGHAAVKAAVVLAEGTAPGTRLIGYARVVPELTGEQGLAGDIARHLRARLPGPMVPGHIVLVGAWPTTVNGKIDRGRLPRPGPVAREHVAPAGKVETVVAEVWAHLLQQPLVGRTDDFFELGGQSLLAVRVSAELARRLDLAVEPVHVMENPTVAALATTLAGLPARPMDPVDAGVDQELLEHIASLPAEAYQYLDLEAGGDRL